MMSGCRRRVHRVLAWLGFIVLVAGCTSQSSLPIPSPDIVGFDPPGAIIAVLSHDAPTELLVYGIRGGTPDWSSIPRFSADDRAEIHLVYYEQTLDTLQIPAGLVALVRSSTATGRALPPIWKAVLVAHPFESSEWRHEEDSAAQDFGTIRLPPFDLALCLDANRCPSNQHGVPLCAATCNTVCGPEPTAPALPKPPAAPDLSNGSACPSEWTTGEICQPNEPPNDAACMDAKMQAFDGGTGCTPIQSTCPFERWASNLPTTAPIFYADATTADGAGQGTQASPYSLLDALAAVRRMNGGTIALSKGTFVIADTLHVDVPLNIVGACTSSTVLAVGAGAAAVIAVSAGPTALGQLTVSGGGRGISVESGARADLEDIAIVPPGGAAIVADTGGKISAHHIAVHGRSGDSVRAMGASAIDLLDFDLSGNTSGGGIVIVEGSNLSAAQGVVVENNVGLALSGAATASVSRVRFTRNRTLGMLANGNGDEHLTLERVLVRDSEGQAISIGPSAQLDAHDLVLERNRDGIASVGGKSSISWLFVHYGRSISPGSADGVAVVTHNATMALDHAQIVGGINQGIHVVATRLVLTDAIIRDTKASGAQTVRAGLLASVGSTVETKRIAFIANDGSGLNIESNASLVAEDIDVEDTRLMGVSGALLVFGARSTSIHRARFRGEAPSIAIIPPPNASGPTRVALDDIDIIQSGAIDADGAVQINQAALTMNRVHLDARGWSGIDVTGSDSTIASTNVTIENAMIWALLLRNPTRASIADVLITGSTGTGIQLLSSAVAVPGIVDITRATVHGMAPCKCADASCAGSGVCVGAAPEHTSFHELRVTTSSIGLTWKEAATTTIALDQAEFVDDTIGMRVSNPETNLNPLIRGASFCNVGVNVDRTSP